MNDISVLSIEQLRPDHFNSVSRLLEENDREEITRHFHPFPMTRETAERLCFNSPKDRYFGAFDGGAAIGLAMLRGWEEGYEIPSFGMFTDYRHHGKGIGRLLVEGAIRDAEGLGCETIRLTVYESNARGLHLYTSLGFQERNREPIDLGGIRDYRIVMAKSLKRSTPVWKA